MKLFQNRFGKMLLEGGAMFIPGNRLLLSFYRISMSWLLVVCFPQVAMEFSGLNKVISIRNTKKMNANDFTSKFIYYPNNIIGG